MVAWNKTLSDSPLVASVRDLGVQFLDNDINISEQEPPEHKSTQRLWAVHGTHQNGSLYLYYHRITMDQKLDVFETFQLDGMGIAARTPS